MLRGENKIISIIIIILIIIIIIIIIIISVQTVSRLYRGSKVNVLHGM